MRGKKERQRTERNLALVGPLSKLLQWLEWSRSKGGRQELLRVAHGSIGAQEVKPFSIIFQDHKQRAGSEMGQLEHELLPVWDASAADKNLAF